MIIQRMDFQDPKIKDEIFLAKKKPLGYIL